MNPKLLALTLLLTAFSSISAQASFQATVCSSADQRLSFSEGSSASEVGMQSYEVLKLNDETLIEGHFSRGRPVPMGVVIAAFEALLARHADQQDFAIGTPVANRGRAELEGLIGYFINMLPLRADVSGDPTFRELVARVR